MKKFGYLFLYFAFGPGIGSYPKLISGPGSSVGIATEYALDGPGSNPGGDEIFRPWDPPSLL